MRVCIFGAGSVGGYLAARLGAGSACELAVIARGAHLAAIREQGLRLETPEETVNVRPATATDRPLDLPPQDMVFATLKAFDLPAAAATLAGMLKPDGFVVFTANGVPWWWNHGAPAGRGPLPLLDPDGGLWNTLGPQRALGCVVYSMNEVIAPGVVRHRGNNRWILGEPLGGSSARLQQALQLLQGAGVRAEASPDLRADIWAKLLKNAPINPVCALTRLATDEVARKPELASLVKRLSDEVVATAAAMGRDLAPLADVALQALRAGGATSGQQAQGVKPSMLQDVLAGRRTEVEAILGQLQAFARDVHVPVPTLDVVVGLLRGCELPAHAP